MSFTNNTPMINCCEPGKINSSSDFQDYETKAGASIVGLEFIRLGAGRQMFLKCLETDFA